MIQNKKVLAVIPARGGSKGIKNKNILELHGKPLIAYTIEAAKGSAYIDAVVVSTDSERIKRISEEYGAWVPFMRPGALAGDETPTVDAVLHVIETLKAEGYAYDILVLLQPTSPLRTASDIDGALDVFFAQQCRPVAAVSKVSDHPILMRTVGEDGAMEKLLPVKSTVRRQDLPAYYKINGSIYVNLTGDLNENTSFNDNPAAFIMPGERALDIDEMVDVLIAQYYLGMYEEEKSHENLDGSI
ncbi:acylneuraminate cytidylyltransferase family protein [Lachnospiraceae bacterium 47-T17]